MAIARRGIWATKPVGTLREAEEPRSRVGTAIGTLDLTALGFGVIVGIGAFVILGEAVAKSGPAAAIAFLVAGVVCALSALAFAELSSTVPAAGGAYAYGYATVGELAAFIVGWDLLLEFGVAAAAVAIA